MLLATLPRRARFAGLLGTVVTLALAPSCAITYEDDDGVTHVWGLAHTEIRRVEEQRYEAVAHQVSLIGLSMLWGRRDGGFALGYSKLFSLEIQAADGAGDLRVPQGDPVDFEFDDFQTILEKHQ